MDWFILDYIEDFIDLTSEQDDILSLQIERLSDWHRAQELPLYVEHLDSLLTVSTKNITQDQVSQEFIMVEQHYERLLTRLAPDLYSLVQTLTDDQVFQLLENISNRHEEYRDKYKGFSEVEVHERYQERISDKVEYWIGRLTKEQKLIIKHWGNGFMISAYEWMNYQDLMHKEWQLALQNRENLSYFQPKFHELLFKSDEYFSPTLDEMVLHNRNVSETHIVKIVNSMTTKQWAHFRKELTKWRDIAVELQE
jgi:hypothetical protein